MTLEELSIKLKTSGLPLAYRQWPDKKAPALPYLLYYESSTDTLVADGQVYYKIVHITVELYTKEKDLDAEAALESAMLGLHWKKPSEQYLETEHMMMCSYEFEV